MFKILADTSTKDLFIALINNEKCIDYIIKKNLLKKTDIFPILFEKLLDRNNLKIRDISDFYCTNGPGSFTGSRSAFIFFKIICIINNKNFYLTSSLQFLARANCKEQIAIDARSGLQYLAYFNNKKIINEITLEISNKPPSVFYKNDFLENINSYIYSFKKVNDLLLTKVNYVKHPSIGMAKK